MTVLVSPTLPSPTIHMYMDMADILQLIVGCVDQLMLLQSTSVIPVVHAAIEIYGQPYADLNNSGFTGSFVK
jgi:hypothetical protein